MRARVNPAYSKMQRVWLWTVVGLMLLTAAVHSLSFFVRLVPQNDTERQLYDLLENYRVDMGAGFHRSTANLITALSACFPLLFCLGALTIVYLARRSVAPEIMRGMLRVELLVFGIAVVVMSVFAFLLPITMTGLVVIALILAERSFAGPVPVR
jgi:hypothetical protein